LLYLLATSSQHHTAENSLILLLCISHSW